MRRTNNQNRNTNTNTQTNTRNNRAGTAGGMGGGMGGGGMGGMGGACYVYPVVAAQTKALDPNPDVVFNRTVTLRIPMRMDDGRTVNMWGFTDGGGMGGMGGGMGGATFPSATIRVNQGDVVQVRLNVGMMMYHTIHFHGIEPDFRDDGVGHLSWDIRGQYTYQWKPAHAGTYFYHCHTNTVLHAEMGMYGALIVDPPTGPGSAFDGGPRYDVEAVWAVDEIDSSWHRLPWTAGMCGGDAGLNDLNPDYFVITGVDGAFSALTDPAVAVTMTEGQTLLIRYICAGYLPQTMDFGNLDVEVIASDGRPLPNSYITNKIKTVSAERYDILVTPRIGVYDVNIDIEDWVTGQVLGTARTRITVN